MIPRFPRSPVFTSATLFRSLSFGFGTALLAVMAKQQRSKFGEQGFELAAVLQALTQEWHQGARDVHGTAAAVLGEGKNKNWMLVAPSTRRTIRTDAGFVNMG